MKKFFLLYIFKKVRVINLTQGELKAMNDLEQLERKRGNQEDMDAKVDVAASNDFQDCGARTISNEMCTFLVMNISSLQLIPVNIIAYRSQSGSSDCASSSINVFSTIVAVVYYKIMDGKHFTTFFIDSFPLSSYGNLHSKMYHIFLLFDSFLNHLCK